MKTNLGQRFSYRYASFIDRYRWVVLSVSLVVAVAAGWLATKLPLYGDFSYLLPQTAPSVVQLHQLEQRVKNLGTVMVAVESADPKLRATAAQDLRTRLEALDKNLVAEVSFDD